MSAAAGRTGPGAAAGCLRRHLALLEAGDLDAWARLRAEGGVMEYPFMPPPRAKRFEGRAAWVEQARGMGELFGRVAFRDVHAQDFADGRGAVVRFAGDFVVRANGGPYRNSYVGIGRTNEAGEIVRYEEYFDPTVLTAALAGPGPGAGPEPAAVGRPWQSWAREFLALVDRGDPARIGERLAGDVRLAFGNDPPIDGRTAVEASFAANRARFPRRRHDVSGVWRGEDDGIAVVSVEAVANYWTPGGAHAALPVTSTFRLTPDGRVREYRIYMDRAPLADLAPPANPQQDAR